MPIVWILMRDASRAGRSRAASRSRSSTDRSETGFREYLDTGLQYPDEVLKATEEYKAESNVVARFIDECCRRGDAFRAASGDAFGLLAGACLMLVVAGIIEAFVTPHFSATVRWSVAAGTGNLFACKGSKVWRSSSLAVTATSAPRRSVATRR